VRSFEIGPPTVAAELVLTKLLQKIAATGGCIPGCVAGGKVRRGQDAASIERVVAEVIIDGAVKICLVPLFGDDVNDSTDGAASFCAVAGVDNAEFANRLLRRSGLLNSRGARHIVGAINCYKV